MTKIIVHKAQQQLELWQNDHCIHTFKIGVGKNQTGHKQTEGDFKTPEGCYTIIVKNPHSKYHLSLGLDYPSQSDAQQALADGRLTQAQYDAFTIQKSQGKTDWHTPLGGEIFIHGELEKKSWSEGCIRMYNADIEILYAATNIGDTVQIFP